jgi:hypothetical protein
MLQRRIIAGTVYYDWKEGSRGACEEGGDGSAACTVRIHRSFGRMGWHASAATNLTGEIEDATRESQRSAAGAQEQSCCRTLHSVLLGFTAGGSGWESSVAITTKASRIQIGPRIDFIYAGAPGVYGSGFSVLTMWRFA